ncbi:hypothetical protein BASA62_003240 [Batrachochytrium salamandrivorans]|nr:hypothetical protein BASA62_003240 [Batrachochytrium salamandrivorans]
MWAMFDIHFIKYGGGAIRRLCIIIVAQVVGHFQLPFCYVQFARAAIGWAYRHVRQGHSRCEATDRGIGIIHAACQRAGYTLFVTADHGNAEKMFGENSQPHTAHTCNPVPFIMASDVFQFDADGVDMRAGALCDVAPTILEVYGCADTCRDDREVFVETLNFCFIPFPYTR